MARPRPDPTSGRLVCEPILLRAAFLAVLACGAAVVAPLVAVAEPAEGPDTMRVRIDAGASSDITNEQYYEEFRESYIDTVRFTQGRFLRSTPETRVAGVTGLVLEGTRAERRVWYRLSNDLSLGDKVSREALALLWRTEPSLGLRFQVAPGVEYRRDRSFGRDLEEWRGAVRGLLRRGLIEDGVLELTGGGDFLRTRGEGADFLPDRQTAQLGLAFERIPLFGDEWRLGYGAAGRVFPDSSERDHFEHAVDGRWSRSLLSGHSVALEFTGIRRRTIRTVPTTRDNYWQGLGTLTGLVRTSESWSVELELGGEALHFDRPDSAIYFDDQLLRLSVLPRFERAARWSIAAGPRSEWMWSRETPSEEYREIAAAMRLEVLEGGAYWSATPAIGWRDYWKLSPDDLGVHSSFSFYDLPLLVDQPLPGALRLRGFLDCRLELHTDSAQDTRSLYFSIDVRRLF